MKAAALAAAVLVMTACHAAPAHNTAPHPTPMATMVTTNHCGDICLGA